MNIIVLPSFFKDIDKIPVEEHPKILNVLDELKEIQNCIGINAHKFLPLNRLLIEKMFIKIYGDQYKKI
jgi:uncharacterized protein (DUF2249 family)